MVSAHSNIHRLRPRLWLVNADGDRKPVPDEGQGRSGPDDPAPHPARV